jgi:hypothetical protein
MLISSPSSRAAAGQNRPARAAAAPRTPASSRAAAALLSAAAAALVLGAAPPMAPAALATPMPNSPVEQAKTLAFGPTEDGSVRACQAVNPNCVSTASTNDLYAPPWSADFGVADTLRVLERAVPEAEPSARLVRSADDLSGTGAAYRAWQADGVFGPDIFEVVVKPSTASSSLVTYRSSATQVKYVYPFQIVVTDGGVQRKRAISVRAATNFSIIGCGEIECFLE